MKRPGPPPVRPRRAPSRLPPMPPQPARTPERDALLADLARARDAGDNAAWAATVRRMLAEGHVTAAQAKAMGIKP